MVVGVDESSEDDGFSHTFINSKMLEDTECTTST